MTRGDVRYGFHQLEVRREFAGFQSDRWWLDLNGARSLDWSQPTFREIAALAVRALQPVA